MIPIAALLEQLRAASIIRDDADRLKNLLRNETLRTLPGANFQGDGFFAAAFAREA